jgi:hypothetical protein
MKETALTDLTQHMSKSVEEKEGENDRLNFVTGQVICKKHSCPTLSHIL